ncbi:MAG: hypothetical protein ACK4YP_11355, partial [Myxococcota bacterium]
EALARIGLVDTVNIAPDKGVSQALARLSRMDPRSLAAIRALTAEHFGAPPAYPSAARATFGALLGSDPTAQRVRRWVDGAPPWLEDA